MVNRLIASCSNILPPPSIYSPRRRRIDSAQSAEAVIAASLGRTHRRPFAFAAMQFHDGRQNVKYNSTGEGKPERAKAKTDSSSDSSPLQRVDTVGSAQQKEVGLSSRTTQFAKKTTTTTDAQLDQRTPPPPPPPLRPTNPTPSGLPEHRVDTTAGEEIDELTDEQDEEARKGLSDRVARWSKIARNAANRPDETSKETPSPSLERPSTSNHASPSATYESHTRRRSQSHTFLQRPDYHQGEGTTRSPVVTSVLYDQSPQSSRKRPLTKEIETGGASSSSSKPSPYGSPPPPLLHRDTARVQGEQADWRDSRSGSSSPTSYSTSTTATTTRYAMSSSHNLSSATSGTEDAGAQKAFVSETRSLPSPPQVRTQPDTSNDPLSQRQIVSATGSNQFETHRPTAARRPSLPFVFGESVPSLPPPPLARRSPTSGHQLAPSSYAAKLPSSVKYLTGDDHKHLEILHDTAKTIASHTIRFGQTGTVPSPAAWESITSAARTLHRQIDTLQSRWTALHSPQAVTVNRFSSLPESVGGASGRDSSLSDHAGLAPHGSSSNLSTFTGSRRPLSGPNLFHLPPPPLSNPSASVSRSGIAPFWDAAADRQMSPSMNRTVLPSTSPSASGMPSGVPFSPPLPGAQRHGGEDRERRRERSPFSARPAHHRSTSWQQYERVLSVDRRSDNPSSGLYAGDGAAFSLGHDRYRSRVDMAGGARGKEDRDPYGDFAPAARAGRTALVPSSDRFDDRRGGTSGGVAHESGHRGFSDRGRYGPPLYEHEHDHDHEHQGRSGHPTPSFVNASAGRAPMMITADRRARYDSRQAVLPPESRVQRSPVEAQSMATSFAYESDESLSFSGGGGGPSVLPGPGEDGRPTKYRKRSRAPGPGQCISCSASDTPEWRRGPNGARTLCNACGLHYSKLVRRKRTEQENESAAVTIEELRASLKLA